MNHPWIVALCCMEVMLVREAACTWWFTEAVAEVLHKATLGTDGPPRSLAPPAASRSRRCSVSSPARQAPPWPLTSASAARGHHLPATNSKIYGYCEAFVNIQLHNIRQRSTRIHIVMYQRRYSQRSNVRGRWSRAVATRIHISNEEATLASFSLFLTR